MTVYYSKRIRIRTNPPPPEMEVWEGPELSLCCPLPVESRHVTLPAHYCVTTHRESCQPGKLTRAFTSSLLLGFHFIGVIGWIIGHKVELNFQPLSPPQRPGWYQVAQGPNPPMCGWFSWCHQPQPESSPSLNYLGTHHE